MSPPQLLPSTVPMADSATSTPAVQWVTLPVANANLLNLALPGRAYDPNQVPSAAAAANPWWHGWAR